MIPTEFTLKAWHVTNGFIAPVDMEVTNETDIWKLKRDNGWHPFQLGDIIIQTPNNKFYSIPYNEENVDSDRINGLEKRIKELERQLMNIIKDNGKQNESSNFPRLR